MFTTRQREESPSVETNRLIAGLEDEFDLLRLRKHSADLEDAEACLADEVECFRESLKTKLRWWRVVAIRTNIFWLEIRRERLAEKRRWYRSLEEEIKFSIRLMNARSTNDR